MEKLQQSIFQAREPEARFKLRLEIAAAKGREYFKGEPEE